jgi:hypothetical protein
MKSVKYLFVLILIVFLYAGCGKKAADDTMGAGIVKASKLALRETPSLEGKIVRYYDFGTPVEIDSVSEKKDKISGIEDYWYRDKKTGAWLFGGYLLRTDYIREKTGYFSSEIIICNVICGGHSCVFRFAPYIIGEYYVLPVYIEDYPEPGSPEMGIIIGKCTFKDEKIIFHRAEEIIGYDDTGKIYRDMHKREFDTKFFFSKDYKAVYKKHKDEEGEFFTHENSDPVKSRAELREKCSDKKNKDEIWVGVNTFIPMSIEEIQKKFPL